MKLHIEIDDALLQRALLHTGLATVEDVVKAGLETLVRLDGETNIKQLRGSINWQGDLNQIRKDRFGHGDS